MCDIEWRKARERRREDAENLKWQKQRAENRGLFLQVIDSRHPIPIGNIAPSGHTLYVIGNGFDLMHRVPSSYYSFRDSLGKNNRLRQMLELALTPEDIWADFEDSLGKQNLGMMGGRDIVDMGLEDSGFYDEDAGAAEYYMAIEHAAGPISAIANGLQPAFRKWVSSLEVGTDDRPLKGLICPQGRALSFNYTEFIEALYGVEDVCYIHGCRKNRREKLVLGHRPGAESPFSEGWKEPQSYHQAVVDTAQDEVFELIGRYDEELTKDSQAIIGEHRSFFDGLTDIDQVVVIGHSLSRVDWDYFEELNSVIHGARWHFGIFGLTGLKNLELMASELGVAEYDIFRTDGIATTPKRPCASSSKVAKVPKARVFKRSGTVVTVSQGHILDIDGGMELVLPSPVKKVVMLGDHIFIVLADLGWSVLLFNRQSDGCWGYVGKLRSVRHQSLINGRLKHVYLTDGNIAFVYNNRIRVFDLATGSVIEARSVRGAKDMKYAGVDVIESFL